MVASLGRAVLDVFLSRHAQETTGIQKNVKGGTLREGDEVICSGSEEVRRSRRWRGRTRSGHLPSTTPSVRRWVAIGGPVGWCCKERAGAGRDGNAILGP